MKCIQNHEKLSFSLSIRSILVHPFRIVVLVGRTNHGISLLAFSFLFCLEQEYILDGSKSNLIEEEFYFR